jgi:DNA polymerase V
MDIRNTYFDEYKIFRNIIIIDIKSFYASVECAIRGLDIFQTPLVVADKERGGGSVVLSVTPYLKALGVPNVCRIFELPKNIDIIYAKPRMGTYIEYSKKIINIYLQYVSKDDLHVYSVDEAFLDVTNYKSIYPCSDLELGVQIMKQIKSELGFFSACGVGDNMLLAKMAMDIEAKKSKNFIARWTYDDIPQKLWPIEQITKMWSIGRQMDKHLRNLGVNKIGDIANNFTCEQLEDVFGIMGAELWHHVHGIDMSLISSKSNYKPKSTSLGNSQVLFRDYHAEDIKVIILEMVDVVCARLRESEFACQTIHLGISYSKTAATAGFYRQKKLTASTTSPKVIYETCLTLFNNFYDHQSAIRRVSVSLSAFSNQPNVIQRGLFDEEDEHLIAQESKAAKIMDDIKKKYGNNAISRGSALFEESTTKARNKMVGGHRK